MTTDASHLYEETPAWRVLDVVLRGMEQRRDITIEVPRDTVINALCRELHRFGLLRNEVQGALGVALVEAGWPPAADVTQDVRDLTSPLIGVAQGDDETQMADSLRWMEIGPSRTLPRTVEELLPLARIVLAAYTDAVTRYGP